MIVSLLVFVFLIFILYSFSLRFWFKPKPRFDSPTNKNFSFVVPDVVVGKLPIMDKIMKRVARNRMKSYSKYVPGYLGLSAVSRAIKKDFGSILSRKQRKHYSKSYGIPFVVYRGS